MKGANAAEFESQVNFLIWETYPRESKQLYGYSVI